MRYAMLLKPHPNIRYRQSLQKLALIELACTLEALGMSQARPRLETLAGEHFLMFDSEPLEEDTWRTVSRHSAVCFAGEYLEDGALRPISRACAGKLPDDLPHVLKYKGKTNADFTYLMLHCAKAASAFARETRPLCVLDPMCGKATTLLCALCEDCDAVGVDMDGKALKEVEAYLERSLKMHRVKHKRTNGALTLAGGASAKWTQYTVAPDAQAMREQPRTLRLIHSDAGKLAGLVPGGSCDLLVCDLPYGVQHAPREGGGMSSLRRLLDRALPGCVHALRSGGAAALAFNLNTLRRRDVVQALQEAGMEPLTAPPYDDFSHWVEQAVERDVVIARKR